MLADRTPKNPPPTPPTPPTKETQKKKVGVCVVLGWGWGVWGVCVGGVFWKQRFFGVGFFLFCLGGGHPTQDITPPATPKPATAQRPPVGERFGAGGRGFEARVSRLGIIRSSLEGSGRKNSKKRKFKKCPVFCFICVEI